jgi:hypothetical protein
MSYNKGQHITAYGLSWRNQMVKKHYRKFWLFFLMIVAIAGCDATSGTDNIDVNNLRLTIAANPTTLLTGEFSSITATLNNERTSVASGTSTTTTTPVPGFAVTFTITQNASKCALTVVNSLTDGSGNATAIYQSGSIAGIDIIQGSIDAGLSASASIIVN